MCTAITWAILSAIIFPRTFGSSEQLQGHVASTWGTFAAAVPRRRQPNFVNDVGNSTTVENGKVVVHSRTVHRQTFLPVKASRIRVIVSAHAPAERTAMVQHVPVDFAGDYTFRNDTAEAQTVDFRLKFPAQKAICDGLQMKVNDQAVALSKDEQGTPR